MRARPVWSALFAALAALGGLASAMAQSTDPWSAAYCEPAAQIKLLYTNRAYLILPKPPDAPLFYYSYMILGTGTRVERHGQLIFDASDDHWDFDENLISLRRLWPLRPDNTIELDRVDRETGIRAKVTFTVIGLEPIQVDRSAHKSWKIRRLDRYETGDTSIQFLWYAPDLCTLSAFTDSQQRLVRLLRVLRPGGKDYDRPIAHRNHKLYFADTNERVR